MPAALEKIREFEEAYYGVLPEDARFSRVLRDTGMDRLKDGDTSGIAWLEGAVGVMSGPQWRDPETMEADLLLREKYASLYMLARGYARVGSFPDAREIAKAAVSYTPGVPDPLSAHREADQYEAIASGRLVAILSTASFAEPTVHLMAHRMAARAVRIAAISEDPERVLFSSAHMTDSERAAARRRHLWVARAARANLWIPAQTVRSNVARRLM